MLITYFFFILAVFVKQQQLFSVGKMMKIDNEGRERQRWFADATSLTHSLCWSAKADLPVLLDILQTFIWGKVYRSVNLYIKSNLEVVHTARTCHTISQTILLLKKADVLRQHNICGFYIIAISACALSILQRHARSAAAAILYVLKLISTLVC